MKVGAELQKAVTKIQGWARKFAAEPVKVGVELQKAVTEPEKIAVEVLEVGAELQKSS